MSQANNENVFIEFLKHVDPRNFVKTFWSFFYCQELFFDEVFRRDWTSKIHPIPFALACLTFVAVISSFAMETEWIEAVEKLNDTELTEFFYAFDLNDKMDVYSIEKQIADKIKTSAKFSKRITVKNILTYLKQEGYENLYLKLQTITMENKLNKKEYPLVFLLYCIIEFSLAHALLKLDGITRTLTETVYVYIYTFSAFLILIPPVIIITEFVTIEEGAIILIILILLILLLVKMIKVFKYTHNINFVSLLCANFLANVILLGFFKGLFFILKSEFPNLEMIFNNIISVG